MTMPRDLLSVAFKGQAFKPYNSTGKHSSFVKFVAWCGTLSGQMDSVVGRNVLNCSLRYNTNVDCTSKLELAPHNINTQSPLKSI